MYHAFLVRRFQRTTNLLRDPKSFIDRDRSAAHSIRKRFTIHQFEHEKTHSVHFGEIVDCCDVGVIQRRENLGFALETADPVRILRANSAGSILIATSRFNFESRAR
jgi:hypothetical protein